MLKVQFQSVCPFPSIQETPSALYLNIRFPKARYWVLEVSDFLVTAPYGGVEQDDFLNGALALKTLLTPQELLERLHEIEQEAHRERLIHWGPRTLDLDILLYDDLVLDTPDLIIPHVEMHLRDFVLIPLTQIAPWKRHPILGLTVSQMLADLQAKQES